MTRRRREGLLVGTKATSRPNRYYYWVLRNRYHYSILRIEARRHILYESEEGIDWNQNQRQMTVSSTSVSVLLVFIHFSSPLIYQLPFWILWNLFLVLRIFSLFLFYLLSWLCEDVEQLCEDFWLIECPCSPKTEFVWTLRFEGILCARWWEFMWWLMNCNDHVYYLRKIVELTPNFWNFSGN